MIFASMKSFFIVYFIEVHAMNKIAFDNRPCMVACEWYACSTTKVRVTWTYGWDYVGSDF